MVTSSISIVLSLITLYMYCSYELKIMGLTLARARKGTSAANGGSKLAYNAVNENLLNKVIEWVQSYASSHPDEGKLKFKSTMTWPTALKIEDFGGGAFEQR